MALSKTLSRALILLVAVLPLAFLAFLYPSLPGTVAIHYDSHMQPNDFAPKGMLWAIHGFMSALSIGIYFLLRNIHRIDPKRKGHDQSATFNRLAAGLVFFLTALQGVILMAAAGYEAFLEKGIYIVVGLLFVFIGNNMHSIKPNYFAGFRLPWALEDEENWRLTHRLGGKLWVAAGVLIVLASLVLSGPVMSVFLFCVVGVATLIPAVYSWRIFKARKEAGSNG